MKALNAIATIAVLTMLTAGCAKSDRNKWVDDAAPGLPIRTTLVGKPTQDAINTKYKSAKLKCDLRTAKAANSLAQSAAGDSLSWDLLMDFSATRTFDLAIANDPNRSFKITLDISKIQVFNYVEVTDADGSLYKMESSPVAEVAYSYVSTLRLANGSDVKTTGQGRGLAHESVAEKLMSIDQSSAVTDSAEAASTEVRCLLATEPKDEFKNQTVVEKKK